MFFTKQRTVATGATWFSWTITVRPLESMARVIARGRCWTLVYWSCKPRSATGGLAGDFPAAGPSAALNRRDGKNHYRDENKGDKFRQSQHGRSPLGGQRAGNRPIIGEATGNTHPTSVRQTLTKKLHIRH